MLGIFYLAIGAAFLFSMLVRGWLKNTYARWSTVRNSRNAVGADVARHLLDQHGMRHVTVNLAQGTLTDHYDPRHKSVSLSARIYNEPSIASVAIAAHECGHAMQDNEHYAPMRLRERLMPVAQLGAQIGPWGIVGGFTLGSDLFVQIGFLLYAAALSFQIVTLPIEFDASRRAKEELIRIGFDTPEDVAGSKKVLRAAAMTYVAGSATAMIHLLFIALMAGKTLLRRFPASGG